MSRTSRSICPRRQSHWKDTFAWRAEGNRRAPRVAQQLGLGPDEVLEAFDASVRPEGQGLLSPDATVVLSYFDLKSPGVAVREQRFFDRMDGLEPLG